MRHNSRMKALLILLSGLVFACAVDAGEEPGSIEEEVSKSCSLAAANRADLWTRQSCCYGADPYCYVTNTAGGITTLVAQLDYGPHMFRESGPLGAWVATPADDFAASAAACAVLSVVPSASVGSHCYVSRSILRTPPLAGATYARSVKFKPIARERAFWHADYSAAGCEYTLDFLPASQCP